MTMPPDNAAMDVVVSTYPALRRTPPDVRLADGAVCPLDDTVLLAELRGWCCPTCLAWWDLRGRCGMWVNKAPVATRWAALDVNQVAPARQVAGDDVAAVTVLPDCDVHLQLFDVRVPARYDGAVRLPHLPWAFMCEDCFPRFGVGLGLGKGQKLVPPDVRWEIGGWCPLDDTLLQSEPRGWSCPACGAAWDHAGHHGWWLTASADLPARLQAENALQAAGLVDPQQRSTCSTCQTWITPGHPGHDTSEAASGEAASGEAASDGEPGGSWFARRRASVIAVAVIETALLCQLAGYLTRDRWAHLLPADRVWWWIAGGLVAAAAVVGAGCALARWWGGWWPYRHNRLLDPIPSRPGPDISVTDISVTGGGS